MIPLRIGTRTSPLAMAQAHELAARLGVDHEIIGIVTSGDKSMNQSLSDIGGKGLFTKELEEALIHNHIDVAVHSMKDMPTELPDGLIIPCVLPREDVRDVLISRSAQRISQLPEGSKFGTSSLRRAAQVLHLRPDLEIIPFRGNVQTRITKIEQGIAQATMLARAGLNRLKLSGVPAFDISIDECLPAVAQGAICVECRAEDTATIELLSKINHADTMAAVTCERAFLKVLDGSCRTPIAGYARIDKGMLHFDGLLALPSGQNLRRINVMGPVADAEKIGREAGEKLRAF